MQENKLNAAKRHGTVPGSFEHCKKHYVFTSCSFIRLNGEMYIISGINVISVLKIIKKPETG